MGVLHTLWLLHAAVKYHDKRLVQRPDTTHACTYMYGQSSLILQQSKIFGIFERKDF